jgi:hypothetical protein
MTRGLLAGIEVELYCIKVDEILGEELLPQRWKSAEAGDE